MMKFDEKSMPKKCFFLFFRAGNIEKNVFSEKGEYAKMI